jgi:hypothetical protein
MTSLVEAQPQRGRGWLSGVGVCLLMLAALGVRLHGIDQALVTFHPTRHYRSAVIARACYYDATPSVPAWARRLVTRSMSAWFPERSYGVIVRRGRFLSPQARAFIELIQPDLFSPRSYDESGHSER